MIIGEHNEVVEGKYRGCDVDCDITFGKAFILTPKGKITLDKKQVKYYEIICNNRGTTKLERVISRLFLGILGLAILKWILGRQITLLKVTFQNNTSSFILCEETIFNSIKRYCKRKENDNPELNVKKYSNLTILQNSREKTNPRH